MLAEGVQTDAESARQLEEEQDRAVAVCLTSAPQLRGSSAMSSQRHRRRARGTAVRGRGGDDVAAPPSPERQIAIHDDMFSTAFLHRPDKAARFRRNSHLEGGLAQMLAGGGGRGVAVLSGGAGVRRKEID